MPSGRRYCPASRRILYIKKEEENKAYRKEFYKKNRDSEILRSKEWNKNNRDKRKKYRRTYNEKRKRECFSHYSDGEIGCAIEGCNIKDLDMLVLDHINGGGNEHRRELFSNNKGGNLMYRWVLDNGFPPGFRVLCANHNLKIEIERHRT